MIRDLFWMAWVLTIGIIEAIIQLFNKDIYLLFLDEDGWKFRWFNRKKR